jgi:hypothetical protein
MCSVSQFWLICVDRCSVFSNGCNFDLSVFTSVVFSIVDAILAYLD